MLLLLASLLNLRVKVASHCFLVEKLCALKVGLGLFVQMKINPYISYVFLYTISAVAFVIKNGDVAPLVWPSRVGIRIFGCQEHSHIPQTQFQGM